MVPRRVEAARVERASADHLRLLFAGIADGRREAMDALYRSVAFDLYGLAVWRTGSRDEGADVLQEVFVALARSRHRLRAVRNPIAYLRRATHRVAIDLERRRRRRPEHSLDACELTEAKQAPVDRALEARNLSAWLRELPAKQRVAIYLRHFGDCSFAEIGRATGVPTFTAASRYRLGMARLRRFAGMES